jgi:hypothetical protein
MSIRFEELVAHSGNSQLLGYEFADGTLTIHLDIDELDGLYAINIPTHFVYGEKLSVERSDLRNCRLDLIELSEILDVERGVYIPNRDFRVMLSEVHCGASLAYGASYSEFKWLLSAIGHSRLLSCLITDLDHVSWYFED